MTIAPRTVYLDHAATTPMVPEALEAMTEQLGGATARTPPRCTPPVGPRAGVVEESRETARRRPRRPAERDRLHRRRHRDGQPRGQGPVLGRRRARTRRRRRMLVSAVEHHAVLDAVDWLAEHEGADVAWLPVDGAGRVHPEALERGARGRPRVGRPGHGDVGQQRGRHRAAGRRAGRGRARRTACRSTPTRSRRSAQLPVDFAASGLDALTLTGHKIGGPLGVGALAARPRPRT